MSHGGGETGRGYERSQRIRGKYAASGNDFSRAIAKIFVAQICESTGFQAFQHSALDLLADITVRYVHNLGKVSSSYANLAGRTEGNALDVIQGLEELGSSQGFSGASDVDHCLASSGAVRELAQYVAEAEGIPFAYLIPPYPVVKEGKPISSFFQIGEAPPGDHISPWLPTFPELAQYIPVDSKSDKIEQETLHTKTDRSRLDFPLKFTCYGSGGPSNVGGSEANLAVESNPFLAAPVKLEEKVVSDIVPPAKLFCEASLRSPIEQNCLSDALVSVVDAFAPAIEAMNSRLSNPEEGEKKVALDQRPVVRFNIGFGRKSYRDVLESKSQNKGSESICLAFEKDSENGSKKKKA